MRTCIIIKCIMLSRRVCFKMSALIFAASVALTARVQRIQLSQWANSLTAPLQLAIHKANGGHPQVRKINLILLLVNSARWRLLDYNDFFAGHHTPGAASRDPSGEQRGPQPPTPRMSASGAASSEARSLYDQRRGASTPGGGGGDRGITPGSNFDTSEVDR